MISGTCERINHWMECWDVSGYSHHIHFSNHRAPSSNPTASIGLDRYQSGPFKTPVLWRLARLEKRLDFGCATRNTTPQAPCTELHGRYRTPKQLARNAKNPGKTRVLQRRGQEPNFWVFSQWFWGVREVVVGDWNTPQKSDWWAFCLD